MSITSVTRDSELLTFTTAGTMTAAEIIAAIREHYPTFAGRCTLWDFSGSDVTKLTQADFTQIATAAAAVLPRGATRKTAYVVSDQASYVAACKYLNAAISARLPAEYAVFTSVRPARDWLKEHC
jgi:hypothetical protein